MVQRFSHRSMVDHHHVRWFAARPPKVVTACADGGDFPLFPLVRYPLRKRLSFAARGNSAIGATPLPPHPAPLERGPHLFSHYFIIWRSLSVTAERRTTWNSSDDSRVRTTSS